MSRRGHCYDAVMESFFSTVKSELADRFDSFGEAKMELVDYIEMFYNQRRRHSTLVAEVRERPADPCVPPLGILDRHPDHARGHVTSRHRPASTAAGAAVVCLGDQSPVPAENRVRRDDAGDLHQDAPAEFLAAHGESTALGIGQAKRPRVQVLPEIRDQIVLVAVHPASERENEEL